MKISHDVRNSASNDGSDLSDTVNAGLELKAAEFRARGAEFYVPTEAS